MILLDTDLIIDYLKKIEPGHSYVLRLASDGVELATTSLNVAEVLRGTTGSALPAASTAADHVLQGLRELPFGPRAARRFGDLMSGLDRAGRPIPVIDGMIAAIALEADCPVATQNVSDFAPIEGLAVVSPDRPPQP